MILFLAMILILIFVSISILHFYWAFRGKKWGNFTIPTKSNAASTPLFKPSFFETLVVAVGFLVFVWIIGMNAQVFPLVWITKNYVTYATFGIVFIFLLRAIGEFRYIGFFKRIKDTTFGQMDSRYYSPLCLLIAITTLIINT
ncbi:DUF3995 domain-containing protein [Runella sp.]|jgi:hypothetical protein|uniref:DUF3995 domain-containing protein n=1 Tax=Runella sp. TaxID=1960881 RepID=UPI0026118B9E|nr:DUF3995 domain-containing protein [Runella sp.]